MSRSALNRTSAPNVVRLFDYSFKQGVIDAASFEDDYTAKEWMEERLEKGDYGLLPEHEVPYDWKRWRFTLYRWCREARMSPLAENYIDKIRHYQKDFLFAILPLSMRFYLMGVSEWLEYPNPVGLALFKQSPKVHWKPVPSHLKKITNNDFISQVQEFVYERQAKNYEGDMLHSRYDAFVFGLWRCLQKYPVYGTDEEETEDFQGEA